jgi:hypothetical protein
MERSVSLESKRVRPGPRFTATRTEKLKRFVKSVQSLRIRWQVLCNRYLPISHENSIWRLSRLPGADDPDQGWKLHISATILSANRVFERAAPLLSKTGVLFKAPCSLEELANLNCGMPYGFSQIGKFITVYSRDAKEAVGLAQELHHLTCGLPGPVVPYDRPLRPNSRVHYRYGSFADVEIERPDGSRAKAIRDNTGRFVPDRREHGAAVPNWVSDPFPKLDRYRSRSTRDNPLQTTFLAYEAISQRGKGGVYRALDLSVSPARLCILKEGRKDGETYWDGKDGYWRVQFESDVLTRLSEAGLNVPRVYARFKSGKSFFLVLEFIEGESLHSLLQRKTRIPLATAIRYGIQLARMLGRIHEAGLIWRDCKPHNLICTKAGELRPIDFEGACKINRPDILQWSTEGYVPFPSLKQTLSGPGTGEDLFGLGVVLHRLLTGLAPKEGEPRPPVEKLRRGVPLPVCRIIADLLEPASPPPEASEVAAVLDSAHHTLIG